MKRRMIAVMLCCLMMSFCLMGCGAKSGSKSIKVNVISSKISLKNVNYYDFYNNVKVSNYTGKDCAVLSNSLTVTEITFYDTNSVLRVACVDKPFSSEPKKIKVYTNKKKSTYDTYEVDY